MMNRLAMGWTWAALLLVLGAAASHAVVSPTAVAPPAGAELGADTDVIVQDIYELRKWGTLDGTHAFSIGTTACNIGTTAADWISNTPRHPVIAQNFYRWDPDKGFRQIGMSWLKHAFASLNENACGSCTEGDGSLLGPNCSDPYTAALNGSQSLLGPRSEVNAFTGVFPYPFGGQPASTVVDKRIQVKDGALDLTSHPGSKFFVEAHYVLPDDVESGTALNNVSYREVFVQGSPGTYNIVLGAPTTVQMEPAINQWKIEDPAVNIEIVDIPGEGRLYCGHKVTDNGDGTWRYDYALFNLNSDRGVQAFGVPMGVLAVIENVDFNRPQYHSGEPFDGRWKNGFKLGYYYFACKTYAKDPNASAIRWSTAHTFRFDVDREPVSGDCGVQLFKPGTPKRVFFPAIVPSIN